MMTKWLRAVRVTLLGGAVALMSTVVSAPVFAQTVEELRQQLELLTQRIEQLEAQQRAEGGAAEPAATESVVESGNDKIRVTLSGQLNRALLYGDNGAESRLFHVDNSNSSTRVRFVGEGDVNDDVTVGTQFEVQFESNPSVDVSFDQTSDSGPDNFTQRKLELYFDSDRFGRLWIGQGDTASNGTSEIDLSGTTVVNYSLIESMAGGLAFQDFGVRSDVRIVDVFNNLDGLSRDDRLRYDTPNFGGFKLSASAIENDQWDAAVNFSGDIGSVRAAAAVAYADAAEFEQVNGSGSILLPVGLSFTGALGRMDPSGPSNRNPNFYYLKVGQQLNVFDIGRTALSVDFTQSKNVAVDGDTATSYGAFIVQYLEPAATELYLGVRNHELDAAGGVNPSDLIAVMAGARVKF